MNHNKAFTLIELLVVIAIITILSAILFPIFARAKENSRRMVCISQMKQIGTAAKMFMQDYQGFPYGTPDTTTSGNEPNTGDYWWMGKLNRYIKNYKIFKCPDDPAPFAATGSNLELLYRTSYALRDIWKPGTKTKPFLYEIPGCREDALTEPSTIAYLKCSISEYTAKGGNENYSNCAWTWTNISGYVAGLQPVCTDPNAIWPHSGGTNYLYFDGHVRWLGKDTAIKLFGDGKQDTSPQAF